MVHDLLGFVGREVVAIEVHLTVAGRPQEERVAVVAHVGEGYLAIHFDDGFGFARRGAIHVDSVDVVLLVAVLVEAEEHPVAVGAPLDPHRALRGTSPSLAW